MRRLGGLSLAFLGLVLVFALFGGSQASSTRVRGDVLHRAAQGRLKAPTLTTRTKSGKKVTRMLPFISASTVQAEQDALRVQSQDVRLEGADGFSSVPDSKFKDIGGSQDTFGCSKRNSDGNTRVNQDCSYRRQAEEDITYSPVDASNIVGGQNDSRLGFNQCGIDWSVDNGKHWGDMLPPFRQRLNAPELMGPTADNPNTNTINADPGTFHSYDAASDPALAVDSHGRSYFSCVLFDVASNASGVFATQAPKGADGSFYFNVPSPPDKRFMVVEDNSFFAFHDKEMIAADRYKSSPNRDNVYVTWTVFKFDTSTGAFTESPIYGSMSTDHGVTWSTPEEISGSAPGLCFFGDALGANEPSSACDFDQGSSPVTLPNGHLEVIFNNGNTPAGNPNSQQLGVNCNPSGSSTDGTAHLNCATPVKVGDDVVVGQPLCDFGRGPEQCIPGAWIRTNDFPRITKDNTQNNHLYATWQDYRNGEFDIQLSMSTDGGQSWHEVGTVNPDNGLDHYFPATDQSPSKGDRVGVSYYRTGRVPGETDPSNCLIGLSDPNTCAPFEPGVQPGVQAEDSDYVLAGGTAGNTPYAFKALSPIFAPPDGAQAGFNGDYSGLTINKGEEAHPIWSDTRNADPFSPDNGVVNDEDIFTDNVNLPKGKGKHEHGWLAKRHR